LSAARVNLTVRNGIVLVGSDGHYWPGEASTAHRAFVQFAKKLNPVAVIMNGDAFDGAAVSRHPAMGWETIPKVKDELRAVKQRLGEIRGASGRARRIWTLGNHDARFEMRLAAVAPEMEGVDGVHLKDHFPDWEPCWSVWINDEIVIKHRYKGGTHAGYNNAVSSGKTMVTGHLHSLKVTPFTDYNGLRWGVDTGCLSDPRGDQFAYGEDNPRDHRSGFIVLKFVNGELMWPDIVYVIDRDHVGFRGDIIKCAALPSHPARATSSRRAATSRTRTTTTSRSTRSTGQAKRKANDRTR
jgi:hypothetical protein